MRKPLGQIKREHTEKVVDRVMYEILSADRKYGYVRNHPTNPESQHIDLFRNYTLMIPSEENARNIVERNSKDKTITWAHLMIEELAEVCEAKSNEEKYNELIQVAALAINAACHLKDDFILESQENLKHL